MSSLISCSHKAEELLTVQHFHLQTVQPVKNSSAMARGDQWYRLRGAVTMEERTSRLGHYYTVSWKTPETDDLSHGKLSLLMDYQQSATASKILHMNKELPGDVDAGKVEFQISGEAYRVGGRVLAWRVRLVRGSHVIAEKQSYLWK